MATAKAKRATKPKSARKSPAKRKAVAKKKSSNFDLSKYLDDIKIGNYGLDDLLDGTSKNVQAIADANRAIVDGYIDIAKRQDATDFAVELGTPGPKTPGGGSAR